MNSRESDKDLNAPKKEEGDRLVKISEEHLIELLEKGNQKTAAECFKHFEKFQKEQTNAQQKMHHEDKEYEHQKEVEERAFKRKNLQIERWWRVFAIVLAAAGFYLFWIGGIETEKANSERAANQHKIDMIQADLNEKKKLLDKAGLALGDLRQANFDVLLRCKYNHPYSLEEQEHIRWSANQKMINAFVMVPYVFNDQVYEKQKELIQFGAGVKDICKYEGNYDDKLVEYKREIFDLANKLILEDKAKIEKLR